MESGALLTNPWCAECGTLLAHRGPFPQGTRSLAGPVPEPAYRRCLTVGVADGSGSGSRLVDRWRFASTGIRLVSILPFGVVAGIVTGILGAWKYAPLVGWDSVAALFSIWVWSAIAGMDSSETAAHANRDEPGRQTSRILLLAASVASLLAVAVVLVAANSAHSSRKWLLAGLAAASVALSWLLVHTLFTLRYAFLYHSGGGSGISFNQAEQPRYLDFAYVAFTIGMTFQISDTDIQSPRIRGAALGHALLSYLFGAVILATTVNFVVALSSSS